MKIQLNDREEQILKGLLLVKDAVTGGTTTKKKKSKKGKSVSLVELANELERQQLAAETKKLAAAAQAADLGTKVNGGLKKIVGTTWSFLKTAVTGKPPAPVAEVLDQLREEFNKEDSK
jgi:hypothetical protein